MGNFNEFLTGFTKRNVKYCLDCGCEHGGMELQDEGGSDRDTER